MVIRAIERQETPGGDQTADIAEHDVRSDGRRASSVGDDVCGDLGVAESTEGISARGDDESRAVAGLAVGGGEEHDVANHHQGCGDDKEDVTLVEAPREEGEEYSEECTDDVRWYSVQLKRDESVGWVDSLDDSRSEECKTLHGDVIEQENEGCSDRDGREDTAEHLGLVHLVENFGCSDTLGLDTGNSQILLLLREPLCGGWTIGEREEGDRGKTDGDDAFDGKDHAPRVQAAEAVHSKDSRSQKPSEGTGDRSHHDVQCEAESQFAASVPS